MGKILFFDGVCVMCNGLVDFILKHDHKNVFKLAPLQGQTAQRLIPNHAQNLNTVVLWENGKIYTESSAILKVLASLGGIFRLAILLYIFPKFLRNWAYRFIAKHRYRWFGQEESCRLPSPEERLRLLD